VAEPFMSFSAGVSAPCESCGRVIMHGLVDTGPVVVHELPVCEPFTGKAHEDSMRRFTRARTPR